MKARTSIFTTILIVLCSISIEGYTQEYETIEINCEIEKIEKGSSTEFLVKVVMPDDGVKQDYLLYTKSIAEDNLLKAKKGTTKNEFVFKNLEPGNYWVYVLRENNQVGIKHLILANSK